jgi:hypothetical protein
MSGGRRTRVMIAAGAVVGVVVVASWWANLDAAAAGTLEHEAATAATRQERLTRALQRAEQQLAAAEQERSDLRGKLAGLQPPGGKASATGEPPPKRADWLTRMKTDPKMQALDLAGDRAMLTAEYAAFYRAHHLSPDQVAKFEEVMARMQGRQMDIDAVVATEHLRPDDPAIGKLRSDATKEYAEAMRDLLGPDWASACEGYDRTLNVRGAVCGLQGVAINAGVPFTPDQAERLTQVLAEASPSYRTGHWARAGEVDWDKVAEAASEFLSADQIAVIKTAEPVGIGSGGRFVTKLNYLIEQARQADAKKQAVQ